MDILKNKFLQLSTSMMMLVVLLIAGTAIGVASYQVTQKQKVLAGAIYNFIKFVEWKDTLSDSQESFNMCLLQHDEAFGPLSERKIQGRSIKIHVLQDEKKRDHCDALYLNTKQNIADKFFDLYKNKKTLTISEQSGFLKSGGIIELGNQNNRLVFSINQLAAETNQMNISFQLLSLAKHVIEK